MPRPAKQAPYHPTADPATFRDLLLFEERLKSNAVRLKKQKMRYQFFLFALLSLICLLVSDLLLHTYFASYPVNFFLDPEPGVHPLRTPVWIPHTYVVPGLLLIAITTLILFFASGMYAEKIGYANRYVPSANRALRSFNMYFNVRSPSIIPLPYPMSLLTRRAPAIAPAPPPRLILKSRPSAENTRLLNSSHPFPTSPAVRGAPLHPLPPSSNRRGELIFSSRIPPTFRESYERYRANFEKRRAEKLAARRWWAFRWLSWRRSLGAESKEYASAAEAASKGKAVRGFGTGSPESSLAPSPVNSRRPSRSPSPAAAVAARSEMKKEERDEEKRLAEQARKKKDVERRKNERMNRLIGQLDTLEARLGRGWGERKPERAEADEAGLAKVEEGTGEVKIEEGDEKQETKLEVATPAQLEEGRLEGIEVKVEVDE